MTNLYKFVQRCGNNVPDSWLTFWHTKVNCPSLLLPNKVINISTKNLSEYSSNKMNINIPEYGKILFGIVIYNVKIKESVAYQSLIETIDSSKATPTIAIFDNSTEKEFILNNQKEASNTKIIDYTSNRENPGLAAAYNYFISLGTDRHFTWLVLLDQDTLLPYDLCKKYGEAIQNIDIEIKICIPIVITNHLIFSPSRFFWLKSFYIKNINISYLPINKFTFINSGLLLNIEFAKKIGGFNENQKVDFIDTEFWNRARKETNKIKIIDVKLKQDFSHFSHNFTQAKNRYKTYLRDLQAFKDTLQRQKFILIMIGLLHTIKLTIKYKSIFFLKNFSSFLFSKV